MKTTDVNPANQKKVLQLEAAWRALLDESLRQGFFGTISLEIGVQNGTIQHVRRRLERVEK
jgi:hypothetical protein